MNEITNWDDWLTVRQAAKLLGVTRQAIYKRLGAGKLDGKQLAVGCWIVRKEAVETELGHTIDKSTLAPNNPWKRA